MERKRVLAILGVLTAFVLLALLCRNGSAQAGEGKAAKGPKVTFLMFYLLAPLAQGDRPAIGVDAERTATNY